MFRLHCPMYGNGLLLLVALATAAKVETQEPLRGPGQLCGLFPLCSWLVERKPEGGQKVALLNHFISYLLAFTYFEEMEMLRLH